MRRRSEDSPIPDEEFFCTAAEAVIERIPQQPQRQDSLDDQLRDLRRAATRLGMYDAADWIRSRTL